MKFFTGFIGNTIILKGKRPLTKILLKKKSWELNKQMMKGKVKMIINKC